LLLEADGSVVHLKAPTKTFIVLAILAASAAAPAAYAQEGETENVSQQGVVELTLDHAETGEDVLAATINYALADGCCPGACR
jgi:hypothetical protein